MVRFQQCWGGCKRQVYGHERDGIVETQSPQAHGEHQDSNAAKRVHLVCRLQSFANVCCDKKVHWQGPDSVGKMATGDWLSIIDVCPKQNKRDMENARELLSLL